MKTKQLETSGVAGLRPTVRRRRHRAKSKRTGALTGWDAIEALAGTVQGPEDLMMEHDHYARGSPKRNSMSRGTTRPGE